MKHFKIVVIFCALVLGVSITPTLAQPSMSRGEQLLTISLQEAGRRAPLALQAEGYVNLASGGGHVIGFKGIHGATIMFNQAPEGKTWINIVVASNSNDKGVPGAERERLQTRMDQQLPDTPPPPQDGALSIQTPKRVFAPNERITGQYSGLPGNNYDWIAIAKAGDGDGGFIANSWVYTFTKRAGTFDFAPLPPGEYEMRVYFNWGAGDNKPKATYSFSVK